MTKGTIILLSGTSSAGKTSLALALQTLLPDPYFRISSDDQFALLHPRFLRPGTPERESVRFPMVRAYYHTLAAVASSGSSVIADTILMPDWTDVTEMHQVNVECLGLLQSERVYFIGVVCSLKELERRERERGNRGAGSARAQFALVHAHGCYDVTVDTSEKSPEECAKEIAVFLSKHAEPTGLRRLYTWMKDE
ncbi:MAG: chloramphenicol phosphotransferase [Armatimonadota bacterium]